MRLVRRVFLAISFLLTGGRAWWQPLCLPGPQHIVCPSCHGLEKLPPASTWTLSCRSQNAAKLSRRSIRPAAGWRLFFGPLEATPRIIVCRSRACARTFGTTRRERRRLCLACHSAHEFAIFSVIAAHELAHIELHWRMGLWGWLRGTVPAWFDEGLATVVSQDPRFQARCLP